MSSVQVSRPLSAHGQRDGIETNLRVARIVGGEFTCKGYRLETADQGAELRQKVCSYLRSRNIVAVPSPTDAKSVLTPGDCRVPQELDGDGWLVRLVPRDDPVTLRADRPDELDAIEKIAHTTLVSAFQSDRNYWHLSESTRFWYRDKPIATDSGVVLLPRISFATHPLDDGAIGISFGSGHMIRSELSVGGLLSSERGRRTFERFREREKGRTGTLIYDTGRTRRLKCYFHGFADGMTVATTGRLKVDQQKFDSLFAYYKARYPRLLVQPNDPVVYVSFAWGQQPVLVDANLLHLRLMLEGEQVPRRLR